MIPLFHILFFGIVTEYWRVPGAPLWSAEAVPAAGSAGAPPAYAVTETFRDGLDRATNTVRCVWNGRFPGGARDPAHPAHSEAVVYPAPGRQTAVSPSGLVTESAAASTATAAMGSTASAGVTSTVIRTRGGGVASIREWDGKWTCETRTAGYGGNGLRAETVVTESSDYPPVTNSVTVSDALGRVLSVSAPAFGGLSGQTGGRLVTSNFYDGASSRLLRRTQTGRPDTLHAYDSYGRPAVSALDVNGNGLIDLSGPDRVTAIQETHEEDASGIWWHVAASITYPETGSPVPFTNALSRVRLTGLGIPPPVTCDMLPVTSLLTAQSETFTSAASAPLRETTFTDAASATVWTVTETPGCALPALRKTVAGRLTMTVSSSCATNLFAYDAMGNRTAVTDGRGNTVSTHYNALGQADYTEDASGNRTSYAYDTMGRVNAVTDALSNTVYTVYDGMDNVIARWDATYPVAYRYDTAGRKTAMVTFRGYPDLMPGWYWALAHYFEVPGPGDLTQWLYDHATGLCTNKVYADGSSETYTFTPDGKPLRTTHPSGRWKENAYAPATGDFAGTIYSDGTPPVTYERDRVGRIFSVTDASGWHLFTRNPDGSVAGEDFLSLDVDDLFTLHEFHDGFGRPSGYLLTRSNTATGISADVTGVDLVYDGANRPSEVAVLDVLVPFSYAYLPGTDLVATQSMPGGVSRATLYEPLRDLPKNFIHRRPNGTVSNTRAITHDALARVTEAVRFRPGTSPALQTDSFAHNGRSELVSAGYTDGAGFGYLYDDIGNREWSEENAVTNFYAANPLNQYAAIDTFSPGYDADGNAALVRTSTGVWHVGYNTENRPVTFTSGNGSTVVEMAYDYMGRCFQRTVSVNGIVASHERYLYRGYLRVAALDMLNDAAVIHTVVWDPTESAATRPLLLQTPSGWYTYSFDQVKNVTELFDSSGSIAGTYDFGPFGETLSASGPAAALNPLRFSSEVWDATLGIVSYIFRDYNPFVGRWLNRDPIGEQGGLNLYGFVGNDPVNRTDYLGMASMPWGMECCGGKLYAPDRQCCLTKQSTDIIGDIFASSPKTSTRIEYEYLVDTCKMESKR
jgi:RHS repeat-associated protein